MPEAWNAEVNWSVNVDPKFCFAGTTAGIWKADSELLENVGRDGAWNDRAEPPFMASELMDDELFSVNGLEKAVESEGAFADDVVGNIELVVNGFDCAAGGG